MRTRSWPRANTLALTIRAGQLTDLGVALTDEDGPIITARAYVDNRMVALEPITGANAVALAWSSTRLEWVGLLPYVPAFDGADSVRVVVTLTIAGSVERLLDTPAIFSAADGR